jgi:hypothetical protein
MKKFLTELDANLKEDSDSVWIIKKPLVYWSEVVGVIEVPIGFETDFASVPRVPFIYELFGNKAHREAVLHDYLYRIDSTPQATYSQANEVFYEAMELRGKSWVVRHGMWLGVVLGGWTAYHKKMVGDKL